MSVLYTVSVAVSSTRFISFKLCPRVKELLDLADWLRSVSLRSHELLHHWMSCSSSCFHRIRIARTCVELGLEAHSPYQKKLLPLSAVPEREQMGYVNWAIKISCLCIFNNLWYHIHDCRCRRAVVLSQERSSLRKARNQVSFFSQNRSVLMVYMLKKLYFN